jgi:regulator of protease activity HflC (stomatin/prohibitin superfamily)
MSIRSTGCSVHEGTRRLEGLIALLIAILVLIVGRTFVSVVTVHDYERGLRYRQGRFSGLVGPGTHVVVRPISEIQVLDGRPAFMTIEGQEVLTADGVALKVSLVARYVVGNPVAAVTGDQSFARALYLELQLGLRETLAAGTVDDILGSRSKIGPAVLERTAGPLARIGIELLSVEVRDLMLPGELKRLFAGVVAARKDGEAELERVRAETAALRSLANAGRMVEENPGLLQLRILHQLGSTSGNTVMLTMPDGQAPVTPGPAATRPRSSGAGRGRATEPPGDA